MKKIVYTFALALIGFSVSASIQPTNDNIVEIESKGGSIKVVNDTDNDMYIYTGSGHVKLYHGGGSTSIRCESGREVSHSNGSKKGDVIFEIESSMCGKTIKLSEYL